MANKEHVFDKLISNSSLSEICPNDSDREVVRKLVGWVVEYCIHKSPADATDDEVVSLFESVLPKIKAASLMFIEMLSITCEDMWKAE